MSNFKIGITDNLIKTVVKELAKLDIKDLQD